MSKTESAQAAKKTGRSEFTFPMSCKVSKWTEPAPLKIRRRPPYTSEDMARPRFGETASEALALNHAYCKIELTLKPRLGRFRLWKVKILLCRM